MITVEEYLKDAGPDDLTETIHANAQVTVDRCNILLERAAASSYNVLNSGWRSRAFNASLHGASKASKHLSAEAADISDPDRALSDWCISHKDALVEIGLWLEHPAWCYKAYPDGLIVKWIHVQIIQPKSGRRFYRPDLRPPQDLEYFDEVGELDDKI